MVQVNVTLTQTIKKLLEEKKYSTLRDILITMMPYDIAAVFEELQDEKMAILFRILPKELAAETFVEMDENTQQFLIHGFSDSELKEVVDELFVDDAVDLIEEMPANVVKRILRSADKDMRKQINELLKYPEDSAGSIMTTEFISLRPDMTAEMAIKRIRRTGVDKETIYTCYVNDDNNKLIGITTVKDLLLAEDDRIVKDIMEENVIAVHTLDDQEEVGRQPRISKKWRRYCRPTSPICARASGASTKNACRGCWCSCSLRPSPARSFRRLTGCSRA